MDLLPNYVINIMSTNHEDHPNEENHAMIQLELDIIANLDIELIPTGILNQDQMGTVLTGEHLMRLLKRLQNSDKTWVRQNCSGRNLSDL